MLSSKRNRQNLSKDFNQSSTNITSPSHRTESDRCSHYFSQKKESSITKLQKHPTQKNLPRISPQCLNRESTFPRRSSKRHLCPAHIRTKTSSGRSAQQKKRCGRLSHSGIERYSKNTVHIYSFGSLGTRPKGPTVDFISVALCAPLCFSVKF